MPVDAKTAAARQRRHDARMAKAREVVPPGPYCYRHTGRTVTRRHAWDGERLVETTPYEMPETEQCPYWKARRDWPDQAFGYCRLLKAGDNSKNPEVRTMLLWDSCKECGVNRDGGCGGCCCAEGDQGCDGCCRAEGDHGCCDGGGCGDGLPGEA